jgi:phosphoribosylformimino-5-aminoimidazole carboxamide ribonucleotide (ProFAR) isomerase
MIIPCIDLMEGKVVQLIRGAEKALEGGTPEEMLARFSAFPEIQVIDLDAATGRGSNQSIVEFVASRRRARVGGGVRTVERAERLVSLGAWRIIVGTSAFHERGVNEELLRSLCRAIGKERVIVALDSRRGTITTEGWKKTLPFRAEEVLPLLEPYCSGFLCTFVDHEGTMQGTDLEWFRRLRSLTSLELTAAGGIATLEEILCLHRLEIHAAVGMAVYTGRLPLAALAAALPRTM